MNKSELKSKLENSIEFLRNELAQIRTGRVSSSLLDTVDVVVYGSKMKIKELGTINILDATTIQIAPWDKSILQTIADSIRKSDLNLNPSVRGDLVFVPIPQLTEETRKEMTKVVSTKVESTKSALRNIRQDAMKDIETGFNNKDFGEDEKFTYKQEVEDIIKEYVTLAEKLGEDKKADILQI